MEKLTLIKQWYQTNNPNLLDEHIVWNVLPNWPAGGVYNGIKQVTEQFFPQLLSFFVTYKAEPQQYYPTHDAVLVKGFYYGISATKGERFESTFVHIWHVVEGKITAFEQIADTAAVQAVL